MKKLTLLSALILGICGCLHAQHLPLSNQYLINKFSLAPAFAGTSQTINLFTGYRNQWAGVKGTPITKMINISAPIGDNVGFGGEIIADQEGYFTRLYGSVTYAYHVKLTEDHRLGFGLTGRVFEHSIDLTNAIIDDPNDPVLLSRQTQNETVVNAGLSVIYRFKDINAGFYAPFLFNNRSRFNAENDIKEYLLQRHYQGFASYNYAINDKFSIEPFAIIRFTEYSPLNFEFASLFKYNNQVWIGASYRREGILAISTGFEYNQQMVFNYSYEFLGNAMTGQSNGTHEFGIGFYIGRGIKKMKENQLALQKTADSLATVTKDIDKEQTALAEKTEKELAKTDAKVKMTEQRLEDVEIELAKAKAEGGFGTGTGVSDPRKKDVDKELLEIERRLKEVGGQFFVVVEAFKIPDNGRKAIELWAVKGLEVQMIYNEVRDFHYIYVGKYPTYNDALKVKQTLNDNGIFGWIYLWKN